MMNERGILRRWANVLLSLLLHAASTRGFLFFCFGNMAPDDHIVQVGTTLVRNCTIPNLNHGNASSMYFQHGPTREPEEYIHVLDPYTVQLRKPNVTCLKPGESQHYYCYIGNEILVSHGIVMVTDTPEQPKIKHCTVYNWESMVCWWRHAKQGACLKSTTTLYWSILGTPKYRCPHVLAENACKWQFTDSEKIRAYNHGLTYLMFVAASNVLQKVQSRLYIVDTLKIVKPNTVKSLRTCDIASQSTRELCIMWIAPAPKDSLPEELLYTISYKSEWESQTKMVNITSEQRTISITLKGLTPYTKYLIEVKCKPVRDGFYSDLVKIEEITKPDVPGGLPKMTAGSFEITNHRRIVTLYWQKLARSLWHGPQMGYRVGYRPAGASKWTWWTQNNTYSYRTIILPSYEEPEFELKVEAQSVGFNESLAAKTVFVDKVLPVMPRPTAIAHKTTVEVRWPAVADAVEYTVYWCLYRNRRCDPMGDIFWESVENTSTSHEVVLKNSQDPLHFLFAVSVQRKTVSGRLVSSGMTWARCTYNIKADLLPPTNPTFLSYQNGGSLAFKWSHPGCTSGYVKRYAIAYCSEDCERAKPDETEWHIRYVDSSENNYVIDTLDAYKTYYLKMRSEAPRRSHSDWTKTIHMEVKKSVRGRLDVIVACAIVASVMAFIAIVSGLSILARRRKTLDNPTVSWTRNPQNMEGLIKKLMHSWKQVKQ